YRHRDSPKINKY
ncbi:hypothetical protein D043_2329B, partial [Vibrio parahaemolyticus EKP-021]